MKYFIGKKDKKIIFILLFLLLLVIGISVYFSYPIAIQEGAVGSSSISSIKDILSLPGVGNNSLPSNISNNWAMVNEIVEPDGTVVQDIVNTDGTVLTITNKQNVISTGSTPSSSNTTQPSQINNSGMSNQTFNRNVF